MTIREYRQIFISRLIPVYGADEAESFFYLALESLTGMRRIDLALKPDTALSAESELAWNDVLSQLLQQVPIQYILGTTHFNGLEFKVTPAVLIPRPETEELVDWVVQSANIPNPNILDIGTGSGCIAISLAHRLIEATVSAMDVSADALQIAKYNADANHVKV
nr:peptide chain release factor N(5)-glutamine methyltransferase [Flavobacterium sp.]